MERVGVVGHEDLPLQIDDRKCLAIGQRALKDAVAGRSRRVVGGADDAARALLAFGRHGLHIFDQLALVPDMIAGGDDMRAEIKEFFGDGGSYAEAPGCIFTIDDEQIDAVRLEDVRQMLPDDAPSGAAEDIAYKQNLQ